MNKNKYNVDTKGIKAAFHAYKQYKVAEMIGIGESNFSLMVQGARRFPREKVGKLAGKIGISTDVIIKLFNLDANNSPDSL